jgi:integrase
MTRIRLPHIKVTKKVLADGAVRVFRYHRKTGKRILGEPGTPDFMASYAEAARAVPAAATHDTLGGLIGRYKASRSFGDTAPSTRRMYDLYLQQILDDWGDMPIGALDDRRVRGDIIAEHDRRAETARRSADYWLSTLRRVISYGHDIGVLNNNHALRIEKAYRADRSDKIWLPEDVSAFSCVASAELVLALTLALHTGQRQGDLLRLTWSAYDGSAIRLIQSKSRRRGNPGREVYVPLTQTAKLALDATEQRAITILTNSDGMPWTQDGFRASWRKTRIKAGITDLTFQDTRGTAVTMLAEAGATHPEIAAITGHSLATVNQILDRYLSRTKPLSIAAISKLEAYRST